MDKIAYNLIFDIVDYIDHFSTDTIHATHHSFNRFLEDDKKVIDIKVEFYD